MKRFDITGLNHHAIRRLTKGVQEGEVVIIYSGELELVRRYKKINGILIGFSDKELFQVIKQIVEKIT